MLNALPMNKKNYALSTFPSTNRQNFEESGKVVVTKKRNEPKPVLPTLKPAKTSLPPLKPAKTSPSPLQRSENQSLPTRNQSTLFVPSCCVSVCQGDP